MWIMFKYYSKEQLGLIQLWGERGHGILVLELVKSFNPSRREFRVPE